MKKIAFLPRDDIRQTARVRRVLYAVFGGVIHTILCSMLFYIGDFNTSLLGFIVLFSVFWAVNIAFFVVIRFGYNHVFSDPSLTLPLMFWAITFVMISVYFTVQLREILLMLCLLTLMFGAFSLETRHFIIMNVYTIFLYGVNTVLLHFVYPQAINSKIETISTVGFLLISIGFSMMALEITHIRQYLSKKNERLEEALKYIESISITDDLTDIKNRRYILNTLEQQRLMAERGQYVFSVCMLDIDHFKIVNDTYGHMVGDSVLRAFCREVEKKLRKVDYFSRVGGEEFLLLTPFSDTAQSRIIAERIRKGVEHMNLDHIVPNLKICVSIGVTTYVWPQTIKETLGYPEASTVYKQKLFKKMDRVLKVRRLFSSNNAPLFY